LHPGDAGRPTERRRWPEPMAIDRGPEVGEPMVGIKRAIEPADGFGDRSPRTRHTMANDTTEPPAMRMGACPYCERTVLVYEEPPRCPICACPLDGSTMRPFRFPSGPIEPATEPDGGLTP